jgi:acetate kinase
MSTAAELRCLCVNAGSSSLKLALYEVAPDGAERRLCEASAQEIGLPESAVKVGGHVEQRPLVDHRAALEALLNALAPPCVDAVGHRVVHGGDHTRPERVTPELLARLEALTPLAPLHNPPALAGMRAVAAHLPDTPQVACFDTAFHATLPEVARTLPLARRYREHGLRRYGFHGLSYEYIARKLGVQAKGRVVVAHLGNGASLAALRDGRSVDTTMGLTPSGGVMMGTRSGDLDPGVLLYLLREKGLDAAALERVIDRESGLLGVSGTSSDMAELLAGDAPDARLAVALFAYQVRKTVGALAAALGGLDRLVFTGGIGEHAAPVRWAVCRGLEYLGIELDTAANEAGETQISAPQARCPVEIIPTDEDAMIARHVYELLENHNAE